MASRSQSAHKASLRTEPGLRKLAIHGSLVEIDCKVPAFEPTLGRLLGSFAANDWPQGSSVTHGSILPYDQAEVVRRLPPTAQPLHRPGDLTEMYALDERAWLIDDRWGLCEINVLRGQWRSWILPQVQIDPVKLADNAVFRPLAQLLKNRGLHLLPAMSVARNHFAVLILSPFGLEQELAAMLAKGYCVVGQRWTCVREEKDKIALLHMPGLVRQKQGSPSAPESANQWVDLTAANPAVCLQHAKCNAVVVVDAGRRSKPTLREWSATDAATVLRLSWPIPELHPQRRQSQSQIATRLAQSCPCFQVQLTRDANDLPALLESIRSASPMPKAA